MAVWSRRGDMDTRRHSPVAGCNFTVRMWAPLTPVQGSKIQRKFPADLVALVICEIDLGPCASRRSLATQEANGSMFYPVTAGCFAGGGDLNALVRP